MRPVPYARVAPYARVPGGLLGPLALVALLLAVHGSVLFGDGATMLSFRNQDLQTQFVTWRGFGFGEMARGNVPLWNPHTFAGLPYVGSWQSALFYPPNWLFLVLPVGHAVNWGIALHLWIAAIGTYAWARHRGVSATGATIAGAMILLGAPYGLRVAGGHLPILCVAAWTPLVFLAADLLLDRPTLERALAGVALVALQILAGHPQTVYATSLVATMYLGLNLGLPPIGAAIARRRSRGKHPDSGASPATGPPADPAPWRRAAYVLGTWTGIHVGAALIAAIQIAPSLPVAAESGRSGPVPYTFASTFPLPPENLLTLVVPGLFGDMVRSRYVGRWFLWEAVPYVGAAALGLALLAVLAAPSRRRRFAGTTIVIVTLIALGRHTPLHQILYDWLPGFGRFRGAGKFLVVAAPFAALLAGMGWDALRDPARRTSLRIAAVAAGALLLAAAAGYASDRIGATADLGSRGEWGGFMGWVVSQSDVTRAFTRDLYTDDPSIRASALFAASQCAAAAGFLAVLGLLLAATCVWRRAAWAVAALAIGELTWYASTTQAVCDTHRAFPEAWAALAPQIGDGRVACDDDVHANIGVDHGLDNVAGYDPVALRRYAQFMTYSQGFRDPAQIDAAVDVPPIRRVPPAFRMLRCRAMLVARPAPRVDAVPGPPLARVLLVGRYEIVAGRDEMLRRVFDPTFDAGALVLLEERPDPEPAGAAGAGGATGTVRVVAETTDSLEIEADVPQPSVLLVTDAYSADWRVRALPESAQREYRVLPANHVLRAVPLAAGRHRFVMEYVPQGWVAGKWTSAASLVVLLGLTLFAWHRHRA